MKPMALSILCWAAANLGVAIAWAAYCLWPRRDPATPPSSAGHLSEREISL
jgi:hypothetical protein